MAANRAARNEGDPNNRAARNEGDPNNRAARNEGDGLIITDLAKRYGSVTALDGLDLAVPPGSLIGFLGPNGAGKTTAMRAILGMVRPDRGTITWNGQPVTDSSRTDRRRTNETVRSSIGYMPQERGLYARMKVREQVIYFGRLAGLDGSIATERAEHWIERLGLADRADALVQELSGGNQQRVQLAVSLVHEPDLLVLDEPFAGLDPVAAETMRDIIAERSAAGVSVLFSSHQLDVVEDLCEDVVIIANGKLLAAGTIADLRSESTTRWLRVRWSAPITSWEPTEGTVEHFDGQRAVVRLHRDTDVAVAVSHAIAAGPVSEVALEPPPLDEIFSELVSASASGVTP